MRFALTDDQVAFRDAARDVLAKDGGWDALVALGVPAVLVPEADGGLGLDEVWLVPVLEETGRVALPHPIVETAMVGAPLGLTGMVATDLGGPLVPWAADADVLLLRTGDDGLIAVAPADVTLEPVSTVDPTRRACRVLRSVDRSCDVSTETVYRTELRGTLGTAAQLVGLGARMLDMTVEHVKSRHQFGVPVGSFQAVKHHLADALLRLEFARPAVYRAAWSLANGAPAAARDVSMAKAMASDAAEFAGRQALQCHGAIGYTVEYDLHLYLKRAWALARAWGDAHHHRDLVGAALGV
jgi:alkylation response protein AidB-like acyl-CoA dehydrogenase